MSHPGGVLTVVRGCEECGFRGSHMSQKEALELRMMEDNVSFDESLGIGHQDTEQQL